MSGSQTQDHDSFSENFLRCATSGEQSSGWADRTLFEKFVSVLKHQDPSCSAESTIALALHHRPKSTAVELIQSARSLRPQMRCITAFNERGEIPRSLLWHFLHAHGGCWLWSVKPASVYNRNSSASNRNASQARRRSKGPEYFWIFFVLGNILKGSSSLGSGSTVPRTSCAGDDHPRCRCR